MENSFQLCPRPQRPELCPGMVRVTPDGGTIMRAYLEAIAIIAGLLGAYIALLPLVA
jgi:hypothetical protein